MSKLIQDGGQGDGAGNVLGQKLLAIGAGSLMGIAGVLILEAVLY